jgi:peroxiredoxin
LRQAQQEHRWDYLLLSDSKAIGAKAFGIALEIDEKRMEQNENFHKHLEDASGEKHHLLPVPSVFIVGTDGVIRFEYVNPNYRIRISPDLLLAAAKDAVEQ